MNTCGLCGGSGLCDTMLGNRHYMNMGFLVSHCKLCDHRKTLHACCANIMLLREGLLAKEMKDRIQDGSFLTKVRFYRNVLRCEYCQNETSINKFTNAEFVKFLQRVHTERTRRRKLKSARNALSVNVGDNEVPRMNIPSPRPSLESPRDSCASTTSEQDLGCEPVTESFFSQFDRPPYRLFSYDTPAETRYVPADVIEEEWRLYYMCRQFT